MTRHRYMAQTSTVLECKNIEVAISKTSSGVGLRLKVPPELEALCKGIARGQKSESARWRNFEAQASFYRVNGEWEAIMLEGSRACGVRFYSDYGSEVLLGNDGEVNVAPLRTVGASGEDGVKLTSDGFSTITLAKMEEYVRRLGIFLKWLYKEHISEREVRATITLEV